MRFDAVLREVAEGLDLPQPDRIRILEEIAGDLEDLRLELIRRGVGEQEAERRAAEMLAPSADAIAELVGVHEPLYRTLARRLSPSGMRRAEWLGFLAVTLFTLGFAGHALLARGWLRDPSIFLIPILFLLPAVVILAVRKAVLLHVERNDSERSLRSGMSSLLVVSGLAIGSSLAGLIYELFILAARLERYPEDTAALAVPWLYDTAVLMIGGLSTALLGGLCWVLLNHKISRLEMANVREAILTREPPMKAAHHPMIGGLHSSQGVP